MVSIAGLAGTQSLHRLAKVAAFLGAAEGEVTQLLEEGRLEGKVIAALRRKGVAVTPKVKNSVQILVRAMEPRRPAANAHQGPAAALQADTTSTIMFTDIVSSTEMMGGSATERADRS